LAKSNVINFKKYLSKDNPLTGRLYFGNIDHEVDQGLESALKLLEKKISTAIDSASIQGQLWTKSGMNPDASVQDVQRAIQLIVKAQATLDALGPTNGEVPNAVNFSNTPPGYLENVDPDQSQRQGVLDQNLPEDLGKNNLDDRIIEMLNIINNKK